MAAEATELTQLLIDSQSPIQSARRAAEQKLLAAEETKLAEYLKALSVELSAENRPSIVRQLAGIVLKNAISGTDPLIDKKKRDKWVQLPQDVTAAIQSSVLTVLQSPCEEARSAACQVVSKVGRLDLPCNKWPQLLPFLMQMVINTDSPAPHKRAAVTAVGYLCEDVNLLGQELSVDLLQADQTNTLMTIVTHSIRDPNVDVAAAGCKAFYHALLFARDNMANETERDFMFQLVGQCLSHIDLRIQHAAWECVLQIASEYYQFLGKYAGDLGKHSIDTIQRYVAIADDPATDEEDKRRTEVVALAALEFWNTLCDVEIMLASEEEEEDDPAHVPQHFIQQAKPVLLPVLFEAMTKQGSSGQQDVELEEWTLAMAAGTCVGLCAQVLKDEILEPALEFVNANFGDKNWKRREAAVLAYGSIMEGPTSERLEPLVQQSFHHLCKALNDESVAVRDSTAWTIGRIAAFHTRCVVSLLGTPEQPGLMSLLLEKLADVPRVASFVCFAIHEIARNLRLSLHDTETNEPIVTPLDSFFRQIATSLLHVAQKADAAEGNLRSAAFEALSEVVEATGTSPACWAIMEAVMQELLVWLERSFSVPATEEICQVQGLICGCLNNITDRLGSQHLEAQPQVVDTLFQLYVRVIESSLLSVSAVSADLGGAGGVPTGMPAAGGPDSLLNNEERNKVGSEEDAVLAVGTLVRAAGPGFERHLPALSQILIRGLQTPNEVRFCRACIGVICELAAVLDLKSPPIQHAITQLLPVLYNLLQNNTAPISLKPPLITTIGDIVVGMEGAFEPYLEPFLTLLNHAASTKMSDGPASEEWVDYLQELRNSVLEAFSGIVHGLREAQLLGILKPHVNNWLNFIRLVIEDPFSSTTNISKATEVTGDLVTSYRAELVNHLVEMPFYHKMLEKGQTAQDEELKRRTLFLQSAVIRCGGKS